MATETEFPAVLAANLDLLRAWSGPSHGPIKQLLAAGHEADDKAYAAELDVFGDHWNATAAHTASALARFLAGQR